MIEKPKVEIASTGTTSSAFVLNSGSLQALASNLAKGYRSAKPFPHVVIDNFLPETILQTVVSEFVHADQMEISKVKKSGHKRGTYDETKWGEMTRGLMRLLNSSQFVEYLEELTGIQGLIVDPHYLGGGLHEVPKGGYLKIHADFAWYERLQIHRRLNVLIYLNEKWEESWGGHLELWDKGMKKCIQKILPIFNRCVIFSTSENSFHGHPEPLTCPENVTRKSLALYYYTQDQKQSSSKPPREFTLYRDRPGHDGETGKDRKRTFQEKMKLVIKQLVGRA